MSPETLLSDVPRIQAFAQNLAMDNLDADQASGDLGEPIPLSPTTVTYPELESAYKLINDRLFQGQLPYVLITLQRKEKRVAGYFSPRRFVSPIGQLTDELALNPAYLGHHNTLYGLQTIAHEMCHIWQFHFGNASRKGYHNKEFATKMESIGLMPSDTGQPGGNKVGQKMDDYVIAGGPFEQLANDLMGTGFRFPWSERDHDEVSMDLDRIFAEKNPPADGPDAKPKKPKNPSQNAGPLVIGYDDITDEDIETEGRVTTQQHLDDIAFELAEDRADARRSRRAAREQGEHPDKSPLRPPDDACDGDVNPSGPVIGTFSGDPVDFSGRDFSPPDWKVGDGEPYEDNEGSESRSSPDSRDDPFTHANASQPEPKQKSPGRIPFICPCKHRIWGKPSSNVFCGFCKNPFLPSTEE